MGFRICFLTVKNFEDFWVRDGWSQSAGASESELWQSPERLELGRLLGGSR